jgi:DNA-binding IclR family transcriptional regulator
MMELGSLAGYQNQLRGAASSHLYDLAHHTNLVVHLTVLDGAEIVYLEKLGGRLAQLVPSRVGGRAPATCTGAGKVMLAFAPESTLQTLFSRPFSFPTSVSIRTERRFRSELAHIQDHGIAFDREESARGLGCVAAPIGAPGHPVAAVSVCGPIKRVNLDQFVGPLRVTAQAIYASLIAGRTPPPTSLREVATAYARSVRGRTHQLTA